MLLSAADRFTCSELATLDAAFNWLMLAPMVPRWLATSAIAVVIFASSAAAPAAVSVDAERSSPAPPPVAVPMLAVVSAPIVSAKVVVPAVVPSLTTKLVAVAEKTAELLKFVELPMLPISVRMF